MPSAVAGGGLKDREWEGLIHPSGDSAYLDRMLINLTLPAGAQTAAATSAAVANSPAATGLIGQAVVSAFVSAIVALIALFFTIQANRKMHSERLEGDWKLAKWRVENDAALAEKRMALDRTLANWKRKTELAEQALALTYEAREVFISARSPGIRSGEGESRPPVAGEEEDVKSRRDTYFIPIERLNRERETFVRIQSLRYVFAAYFGEAAAQPLRTMITAFHEITSAASTLVQMAPAESGQWGVDSSLSLRQTAFATGTGKDPITEKLDVAVSEIEKTCAEVLRGDAARAATDH